MIIIIIKNGKNRPEYVEYGGEISFFYPSDQASMIHGIVLFVDGGMNDSI